MRQSFFPALSIAATLSALGFPTKAAPKSQEKTTDDVALAADDAATTTTDTSTDTTATDDFNEDVTAVRTALDAAKAELDTLNQNLKDANAATAAAEARATTAETKVTAQAQQMAAAKVELDKLQAWSANFTGTTLPNRADTNTGGSTPAKPATQFAQVDAEALALKNRLAQ